MAVPFVLWAERLRTARRYTGSTPGRRSSGSVLPQWRGREKGERVGFLCRWIPELMYYARYNLVLTWKDAMPDQDGKRKRTWQEIAEEASREKNPQRLLELTRELEAALDDRDKLPATPTITAARGKTA